MRTCGALRSTSDILPTRSCFSTGPINCNIWNVNLRWGIVYFLYHNGLNINRAVAPIKRACISSKA
ncbi:hypothetical protein AGABI2DRAFT_192129 [Agaricus bisporus var. bisporus H97]|uniref:hypothetical protein n=1 Tax=Agaricus bisporus var. bisporus (strain H97 / ATCC MYA-4626 / FGSC 10389) TaxID=936046 RepID=UPI00029F6396|nr:hypothetical protein AGABI2DRAFT_192129 [Agaricus bisporus var. bisporus H97]EKV48544.1 hypothetical protein AGABI2DRAFT_192129 [Agaricus bisporus var. bisporus H97]